MKQLCRDEYQRVISSLIDVLNHQQHLHFRTIFFYETIRLNYSEILDYIICLISIQNRHLSYKKDDVNVKREYLLKQQKTTRKD